MSFFKIKISILIFVAYSFKVNAQNEANIYNYWVGEETSFLITEKDTVSYKYKDYSATYNSYTFKDDKVFYENEIVATFVRNKLYIENQVFRFKRPWLKKSTYLINTDNKKELISYDKLDSKRVSQKISNNLNSKHAEISDILLAWSLYKEAGYLYYNYDEDNDDDAYLIGFITGFVIGGI